MDMSKKSVRSVFQSSLNFFSCLTAILLYPINDSIIGLWNTSAGDDSKLSGPSSDSDAAAVIQAAIFAAGGGGNALPGKYNLNEIPEDALDRNENTKYTSYGFCNGNPQIKNMACGINTGFHLTLGSHESLLTAFRFRTANDYPERDPLHITIEGSNENPTSLTSGSSWTLIYNGPSGLNNIKSRCWFGITMKLSNNFDWFTSYRILVNGKRNSSSAVQYSDVELLGYYY